MHETTAGESLARGSPTEDNCSLVVALAGVGRGQSLQAISFAAGAVRQKAYRRCSETLVYLDLSSEIKTAVTAASQTLP